MFAKHSRFPLGLFVFLSALFWCLVGCQAFLEKPSDRVADPLEVPFLGETDASGSDIRDPERERASSKTTIQLVADSSGPTGPMPIYRQVVLRLLKTAKHARLEGATHFRLTKRDTMYEICWMTLDSSKELQPSVCLPFWSPERGYHHRALQFGTNDSSTYFSIDQRKNELLEPPSGSFERTPYDVYRFYGYEGWQVDHLNYYERHPPSTVPDLYAAALLTQEQYTNYAFERAHHLTQAAPNAAHTAWLSQIEKTEQYYRRALEADQDAYHTFSGALQVAFAQERTHVLMLAKMLGMEELAEKTLSQIEGYPSSTLSFARLSLNSCLPHSLLFASGAKSFYPLYYVQYKENLLSDVLLVNIQHLDQPVYLDHLRNADHYPQSAAALQLTPSAYRQTVALHSCKEDQEEPPLKTVEEWINALHQHTVDGPVPLCATDSLQFSAAGGNIKDLIALPSWSWRQLLSLDLLASNIDQRPILMTGLLFDKETPDFLTPKLKQAYTEMLGPLYRFLKTKKLHVLSQKGMELNQQLHLRRLDKTPVTTFSVGDQDQYYGYFDFLSQWIENLVIKGEQQEAKDVLSITVQRYSQLIPLNQRVAYQFLDWCYEWNLDKEGKLLNAGIMRRLVYLYEHPTAFPTEEVERFDTSTVQSLSRKVEQLRYRADRYGYPEEYQAIKRLYETLNPSSIEGPQD